MAEPGEEIVVSCDLFTTYFQESKGLRLFRYAINLIDDLDDELVTMLMESIELVASDSIPRNIVLIDGTALTGQTQLLAKFVKVYYDRISTTTPTGLKKFIMVTQSNLLTITTNTIRHLNGSGDIVVAVQSMDEARKILAEQ